MVISILTLFPDVLRNFFSSSILKRAQEKELVRILLHDIRSFATDKYGTVDGKPYGGGVGMLLRVDVLHRALNAARGDYVGREKSKVFLMDPAGKVFTQKNARNLIKLEHLILICGHYEGFDARIDNFIDGKISIGRYVLTGGELPACIVTDALVRLLPGVLKDPVAVADESFSEGIARVSPQYTRPENYKGFKVPQVLLSGNHVKIADWKEANSLKK